MAREKNEGKNEKRERLLRKAHEEKENLRLEQRAAFYGLRPNPKVKKWEYARGPKGCFVVTPELILLKTLGLEIHRMNRVVDKMTESCGGRAWIDRTYGVEKDGDLKILIRGLKDIPRRARWPLWRITKLGVNMAKDFLFKWEQLDSIFALDPKAGGSKEKPKSAIKSL